MRRSLATAGVLSMFAAACSDPAPRPVPAKLAFTQQVSSGTAGSPFAVVVAIQDANGGTVGDATSPVIVAFTTGGSSTGTRALGGTLTRNAVAGVATFNDLTIDRAGGHVLAATSGALTAAQSAVIAIAAGAPTTHTIHAGNNQFALPSGDVMVKPAVRIADAFGNPIAGISVTFEVASGGGSITGATQTTGVDGIATVGSWTLGASGTNTLNATVSGPSLAPATFSARVSTVFINSISPAVLSPGVTATITGSGFSATAADNVMYIESTPVTVTSSTPTSITFTVPALVCEATHEGTLQLSVLGEPAAKAHTIQAATQRALGVGESLIISNVDEARCNELTRQGGLYYVSVFNTNRVYSPSGAQFELRGAPATGPAAGVQSAVAQPRLDLRHSAQVVQQRPVDEGERLHERILEENIRLLQARAPELRRASTMRGLRAAPSKAYAVGDMQLVRLPNVNTNFCSQYFEINTRVAYAGTRAIILEDVNNQLYNQIDTTWDAIGQEFDNTMFGILETNFGNPLAMDALTDNNGKVIMVFSRAFNDNFPTLGGFVVTCDFSPRNTTNNASSNFGEYFYARTPIIAGTLGGSNNTPPNWQWSMRSTIIHEVKHILSFGERIKANTCCEQSWLEESTARLSEEMYERANYLFAQRANIPYGNSGDQRGPWCGVRACNGKPRGFARIFEDLNLNWYRVPDSYSPIGRTSQSDFSFYNTAWSLLRWSIDHSAMAEADFIKALVQGPESGIGNLEARTGRNFADMLPEWTLAMVLDDYPGLTVANARLRQPSWNLPNLMQGMNADFPSTFTATPFNPSNRAFGTFSVLGQVVPGTASFLSVGGGAQTAKQLIELKAVFSPDAAPAELRLSIVRIQ